MFFDAEKMGNDAGFTTSHEFQNRWDNIYLLEVPDGGSLYIKLGASPNNKERIDNHEVIGLINVCYMPNFPNSMETDGTVRVIKNNLNDDHYMITGIGSLIDIDMGSVGYVERCIERQADFVIGSLGLHFLLGRRRISSYMPSRPPDSPPRPYPRLWRKRKA